MLYYHKDASIPMLSLAESTSQEPYKTVLYWAGQSQLPSYFQDGTQPFSHCPIQRCQTTRDIQLLGDADAVLVHMHHVTKAAMLPPTNMRTAGQYYIFYLRESPASYQKK